MGSLGNALHFPAPHVTIIPPTQAEPNTVVADIDNGYFTTNATESATIDYSSLLPSLSVEFNAAAVQQIATTAGDSSIKLKIEDVTESGVTDSKTIQIMLVDENDNPVYAEGTAAGTATITVPFPVENGKVPVVYFVDGSTKTKVDGATYNSENQTVTFTVTHFSEYEITTESAYVAQVVTDNGLTTNKYETLADAFTAANAAGTAAITILDDYTLVGNVGVTVNAGSNITLDLNGHTLSQVGPMAGAGYFIRNNGTLTLKDSTDILKNGTGNGRMTTSSENPDTGDIPSYANNLISNYGTLTIESGYYKSLTNAGYASFVVDNYSGGTANITGGELCNVADYAYVVRMFLNSTTAENALNISGTAVIDGSYAVWMQYPNGNANKASLNISGGTITATSGFAVYAGGNSVCNASNISVSFSGGTVGGSGVKLNSTTAFESIEVTGGTYAGFLVGQDNTGFISGGVFQSAVPETYCADGYIPVQNPDTGLYTVEEGTYVAQIVIGATTNKYASLDAAVAAAQSGDMVTLLADATLGVDSIANDITLDTAGHDMTVAGQVYLYIDGNVVFTNSAYNAADPTASGVVRVTTYGVCPYTGGSLTIANGRYEQIVAENHLFYTMGGNLVINDGSFDASNSVVNTYVRSDGKPNGFGGTVTVNGGDFHVGDTSPYTIIRANQGATVTINGGNFDADGGYVMISATVAGNSAAPASIAVNGGTFADGAIISANDTSITIADGTFTQIELASCDDSAIAISDGLFEQTELAVWDDSSIAISGGLFDFVVPEALCAEGCIPSTETTTIDGVEFYMVKQGSYVAQIVTDNGLTTNKYETLAAAFAAANAAGTATIEMLEDVNLTNESFTVSAGKNITLDLNGKTVQGMDTTSANFAFITNRGTLTITDTSADKDGVLVYGTSTPDQNPSPRYGNYTINNAGILNIDAGTVNNNTGDMISSETGYSACYAVNNISSGSDAILTVNGGRVTATGVAVRLFAYSDDYQNTLNVNGGAIETSTGYAGVWNQLGTGHPQVSLNVTGGTVSGASYAFYDTNAGCAYDNVSYDIDGGEFTGYVYTYGAAMDVSGGTFNSKIYDNGGDLTISGGTFYRGFNVSGGGSASVSGGSFATAIPEAYCADGYIPTYDPETGYYTVKQGVFVAQILGKEYARLSAPIAEASDDVYIDILTMWSRDSMVDANGNACPRYIPITDETLYGNSGGPYNISAKYAYDTYFAPGMSWYSYQTTSYLYVETDVVRAKYESLAEAIAAVSADGKETTIEMIANVAITNVAHTIAAGQNIILDLNGKTIDGFCNTGANFAFITNNGTLVIQDSSDAEADGTGDGKLLFAASPAWIWDGTDNYAGSYISDLILNSGNGEITVRSGYIANMLPGNACYAIDTGNPAANALIAINVEGGHIWATNTAIRVNVRKNGSNGYAFYMTGGTVEGVTCAIAVNNYVAGVDVDVTIEGGSIIGWKEPYYGAIDNAGSYGCDLTITGGDFVGGICLVGDSTVYISGGTFNGNVAGNSYFLFDEIESASITDGLYGDLSYWMRPLGAISGGLFASKPYSGYIAPGFFLVDNTDPTTAATYPYRVVSAKAMVLSGTGTVTTNYYSSVANAFAVAAGKTVVMLDDETLSTNVVVTTDITLDLAGHALDRTGFNTKEESSSFVVNGATFTVTNSTGSGSISNVSKGYTIYVKNDGVLNVQDGTISGPSYAIHALGTSSSAAAVNVSGGTVSSASSYAINMLGVAAAHPVALSVTGGTVSGGNAGIYVKYGSVDVSGGNVTATSDYGYGINAGTSGTVTVSGGVISGGYGAVSLGAGTASASISGGTLTGGTTAVRAGGGDATITGGTLTGGTSALDIGNANSDVAVSGGQFSGGTSIVALTRGTASLSGGVYSIAPATEYVAEGYTVTDNADAETAVAYPYTVMPATPTYEITWVSEGEIMATEVVASNTVPVYTGETPVKDPDDNGIYIFRGWTPKVEAAVSNTTYTAKFSNSCTIRWMAGDTVVKSVSVTNGTPAAEVAALAPIGANSSEGNVRFVGWLPAVYVDALGDADYIAQFEAIDFLAGIVPGTLHFTSIKANGRKVAVTFEFKPTGGETDAYRLIYKTAIDSAETFVSDIANVTLISGDENSWTATAEVILPEGCEAQAFVTGLDFTEKE